MSLTDSPAPTDIEAFQAALQLAEENGCDPPENAVLLRALRIYRILNRVDVLTEVFVSEDGAIELSALGGTYRLTVVVERNRLVLVVTPPDSGSTVVSDDHSSEEQILEWVSKAA